VESGSRRHGARLVAGIDSPVQAAPTPHVREAYAAARDRAD